MSEVLESFYPATRLTLPTGVVTRWAGQLTLIIRGEENRYGQYGNIGSVEPGRGVGYADRAAPGLFFDGYPAIA